LGAGIARVVTYKMWVTRDWNYVVRRKLPENIRFEINKIIDSKGMDSVGIEGKLRKIFG